MSQQSYSGQDKTTRSRGAELLVFAAIALITAAVWFGLVLHAGLTSSVATSAAFAALAGLVMAHKLFRRSRQAANLQAEIDRLQSQLRQVENSSVVLNTSTAPQPPRGIEEGRLEASGSNVAPPNKIAKPNNVGDHELREEQTEKMMRRMDGILGRRNKEDVNAPPPIVPSLASTYDGSAGQRPPSAQAQPATAPQRTLTQDAAPPSASDSIDAAPPPAVDKMRDLSAADGPSWQSHANDSDLNPYLPNFSKGPDVDEAATFDAHFSPAETPSSAGQQTRTEPTSNIREVDVKKVHGLIKKLAEQVNAVEALSLGRNNVQGQPPTTTAPLAQSHATPSANLAPRTGAVGASSFSDGVGSGGLPQAAAGASVNALNSTAETMRTYEPSLDLTDEPISVSPVEQSAGQVVVEVSDALASGRMNILLSPIHGLQDRRAQHYEVSIELHNVAGKSIDVSDLHDALRGTALLPALDSARLARTAQIGERMADRGFAGALFSDVTCEALDADQFLNTFADAYQAREAFAAQLVIVFQQRDVRRFEEQAWATLYDMQHLGFRFALAGVTDLDMDFAELKAAGFAFVKLTAEAFLSGLPALGRRIQPSNVCQHLGQAGLTLVVDGIASEDELAKIFGFGVLFGQGQLFGGARAVRSKPASSSQNREAAA